MTAAKVARVKRRDYAKAALPETAWRKTLKAFAYWVLLGLLGWMIFASIAAIAFYA